MNNTQYKLLDGNWLASLVQAEIQAEVLVHKEKIGRAPGLGVILIGDNPASKSYIARKKKVAEEKCAFVTKDNFLPADATLSDAENAIREFNQDETIDGILLQLPTPDHIESNFLLDSIHPLKDADGLHPYNQGLLLRGEGVLRPCTPQGVMAMIDLAYSEYQSGDDSISFIDIEPVDLSGKSAVVVGRSILVGKPLASMLLERNCTVTQVHSKTKNPQEVCSKAEILVAAVGSEHLVKEDWVQEGAVVIDVGTNKNKAGKLVGDVDFEKVAPKTKAISPVPKGVGPMTVAMLLKNTLECFRMRNF